MTVIRLFSPAPRHGERAPLRRGWWPAEKRIPVLASAAARLQYDRACLDSQALRQAQGQPFRDFESTVFTVPKKDGRFRLCTDYRPLNEFQTKRPFKMENVQTVAETIQPRDCGMLVDLTDCYLTMGLPPSQRKYCRFGIPRLANACSGRRLASVCPKPPAFVPRCSAPLWDCSSSWAYDASFILTIF
jgi:hypothetical protein